MTKIMDFLASSPYSLSEINHMTGLSVAHLMKIRDGVTKNISKKTVLMLFPISDSMHDINDLLSSLGLKKMERSDIYHLTKVAERRKFEKEECIFNRCFNFEITILNIIRRPGTLWIVNFPPFAREFKSNKSYNELEEECRCTLIEFTSVAIRSLLDKGRQINFIFSEDFREKMSALKYATEYLDFIDACQKEYPNFRRYDTPRGSYQFILNDTADEGSVAYYLSNNLDGSMIGHISSKQRIIGEFRWQLKNLGVI